MTGWMDRVHSVRTFALFGSIQGVYEVYGSLFSTFQPLQKLFLLEVI